MMTLVSVLNDNCTSDDGIQESERIEFVLYQSSSNLIDERIVLLKNIDKDKYIKSEIYFCI
jgi:hypothetical protein